METGRDQQKIKQQLDALRDAYIDAVETWRQAIEAEVQLATPDHSIRAIDVWEHAHFREESARTVALKAKSEYEDALRNLNFNF